MILIAISVRETRGRMASLILTTPAFSFSITTFPPSCRRQMMLHRVVEAGLARQVDPDGLRRPVVEITPVGVAVMKAQQPPPGVLANLIPQARKSRRGTTVQVEEAKMQGVRRVTYKQKHYKYQNRRLWALVFREVDKPLKLG